MIELSLLKKKQGNNLLPHVQTFQQRQFYHMYPSHFYNLEVQNKLFRNPSLYLGEGYMNKEIVIEEGTLDDFLKIITASYNDIMSNNFVFKMYESISTFFKSFQQINKLVRSKENVAHHYDIDD
jgi:cyclopropane-fatty-acyl-phospholipid synthase